MLPEFHTIFTINYYVAFKIFLEQNYYFKVEQKGISKWGTFDNLLFQSGASVISKWGRDSYFKVSQCLFQSGANVISKWGSYFKVRQNVTSQWAVISKWDNYFKVGHNIVTMPR